MALGENGRWLAAKPARKARAGWWSYTSHVQTYAWGTYGYQAVLDVNGDPTFTVTAPLVNGGSA